MPGSNSCRFYLFRDQSVKTGLRRQARSALEKSISRKKPFRLLFLAEGFLFTLTVFPFQPGEKEVRRLQTVIVDSERCKGCGYCLLVCRSAALAIDNNRRNRSGYPVARLVTGKGCSGWTLRGGLSGYGPEIMPEQLRSMEQAQERRGCYYGEEIAEGNEGWPGALDADAVAIMATRSLGRMIFPSISGRASEWGVFLQAESELAVINMVLGTAATEDDTFFRPRYFLMGGSLLWPVEPPAVVVNITCSGPGLGHRRHPGTFVITRCQASSPTVLPPIPDRRCMIRRRGVPLLSITATR